MADPTRKFGVLHMTSCDYDFAFKNSKFSFFLDMLGCVEQCTHVLMATPLFNAVY
jgi:hypothetical protein